MLRSLSRFCCAAILCGALGSTTAAAQRMALPPSQWLPDFPQSTEVARPSLLLGDPGAKCHPVGRRLAPLGGAAAGAIAGYLFWVLTVGIWGPDNPDDEYGKGLRIGLVWGGAIGGAGATMFWVERECRGR